VAVMAITTPQLFEDVIADGLEEELLSWAGQVGPRDIVLDLHEVQAVSSAAIGAIGRLRNFVQRRGHRLVLSSVGPCVAEAFHLARLAAGEATIDLLIPTQPDVPSAVSWLGECPRT
jgi:anti-anti-sigma factor